MLSLFLFFLNSQLFSLYGLRTHHIFGLGEDGFEKIRLFLIYLSLTNDKYFQECKYFTAKFNMEDHMDDRMKANAISNSDLRKMVIL